MSCWYLLCPGDHHYVLLVPLMSWRSPLCPAGTSYVLEITSSHAGIALVSWRLNSVYPTGPDVVTEIPTYVVMVIRL